jgi:hypothetical protein
MRGFVYTARDVADNVLYVGVTRDVPGRMSAHRRTSRWWPLHATIDVKEFATLEEALTAEDDAICRYDPPFNVAGGHGTHGGTCRGRRCERLRRERTRILAWHGEPCGPGNARCHCRNGTTYVAALRRSRPICCHRPTSQRAVYPQLCRSRKRSERHPGNVSRS